MRWMVMREGVVTGPHDTAQVVQACGERRISRASYLREEPGGTWQRADQGPFAGLFPAPVSMGRVFLAVWLILALIGIWVR